jgi:hypothetical protein
VLGVEDEHSHRVGGWLARRLGWGVKREMVAGGHGWGACISSRKTSPAASKRCWMLPAVSRMKSRSLPVRL